MPKIKNSGLDQYDSKPFEQQQFFDQLVLKGLTLYVAAVLAQIC